MSRHDEQPSVARGCLFIVVLLLLAALAVTAAVVGNR